MATPPVCRYCGTALPRAAMFCPRCHRPTFLLAPRRARRRRDEAVVGMTGSLVMVGQSAFMLVGGVLALLALGRATRGDLADATSLAATAAVFVGVTLLFDLFGISLLAGALWMRTKSSRSVARFDTDRRRTRRLATLGLLATVFLVLWVLVTLGWRLALAAIVEFYPTPFGGSIGAVGAEDLRRAASIMLGLWVAAAFLLFLGATFGVRFLQGVRRVPMTFARLLWPLETFIHFAAAFGIALIAPELLESFRLELTTLRIVETLGVIDLVLVPVLGVLAYAFLFREFLGMYREGRLRAPARPVEAVAADPGGES